MMADEVAPDVIEMDEDEKAYREEVAQREKAEREDAKQREAKQAEIEAEVERRNEQMRQEIPPGHELVTDDNVGDFEGEITEPKLVNLTPKKK